MVKWLVCWRSCLRESTLVCHYRDREKRDERTSRGGVDINIGPWREKQMTLQKYSRLSLSRLRLSRITAYLEVKIGSLFKHVNVNISEHVSKYCGKEEKLLLRSKFSSFAQYFQYASNFRSQITYLFEKCAFSIYFFPQFCKSDMSRYGCLEVFQRVSWTSR